MNLTPEFDEIPQSHDSKHLELGDFVCPRYMAKTAEQAIAQGFVYQIIKVNQPGSILTVHRVSDPKTQIIVSSDFFISLQEEESEADIEVYEEQEKQVDA
jgi:hypothetical protein